MKSPYRQGTLVSNSEPPFGAHAPTGLQSILLRLSRIPPFYRGAFRDPLTSLIRSFSQDGIIDVERFGGCFRLRDSLNLIENGILIHPHYNKVEIEFLKAGTPAGGSFIDLGSNVGLYTLPLAVKAGETGTVLAVDANPDIIPVLAFNVEASSVNNVIIANTAVSDMVTNVRLEIRKDDLAIVNIAEDKQGEFQTRKLLDVVNDAGLEQVHTMKADIEGFEDRAILPYLDTCSETQKPDRIVIEHLSRHGWRTDCFPVFARHGYEQVGATRGNTLFLRKDS